MIPGVEFFLPVTHHHHYGDMFSPFFIYTDNPSEAALNQDIVVLCFNPADLWRRSCDPRSHDPLDEQPLQLSAGVRLLLVQTLFYLLVIYSGRPSANISQQLSFQDRSSKYIFIPVFLFSVSGIFKFKTNEQTKNNKTHLHKRVFVHLLRSGMSL